MERLLTWARENPQFAALTMGGLIVAFVLGLFAVLMSRSGMSLRPIIWFAGFFGIIAGPQAFVHLLDGLAARKARQDSTVSSAGGALKPIPWEQVFGPEADPTLITDATESFAPVIGKSAAAKLSFSRDGTNVLAARFDSPAEAQASLNRYGQVFGFAQVQGSDANGWTARRFGGQGEWSHVVVVGSELYAWTGADRNEILARRTRALGPWLHESAGHASGNESTDTQRRVSRRLVANTGFLAVFLLVNLTGAVFWFFKGSAWAARVEPAAVRQPLTADDLRRSLLALNQVDRPVTTTLLPDGSIEVNWRYADARWFDLMRVHRLKRVHRLVLQPDEDSGTVRVREYWSAFDASAGLEGATLRWKAATGIQFFAIEHQRVLGAQLGSDGRPTGELSKAYTFNLQELKQPIIDTVTQAGWRWQPVTWNAPRALRWLTE